MARQRNPFCRARSRRTSALVASSLLPRRLLLALGASSGAMHKCCRNRCEAPRSFPKRAALDDKREGSARFFDPEDGQFDLSYFLENPRGFLPIPIVVTEPAVGYGGGVAGMFLRPRREAGDEGWARPDISGVGAFATQNGTWGAFGGDASRWLDGRLRTLVGAGTGQLNLDFYGLGPALSSSTRPCATRCSSRAPSRRPTGSSRPSRRGRSACATSYADVEPKLRDDPLFPGLADRVRVKISAPTAIVEFDTRDNVFTPTQGIYAESSYLASREALGASVDFERFEQVLIGWHPLPHDVTLGRTRELRVVVGRHAVLPAALRAAARRARGALPGRPGGVARGRGALAVHGTLERRRVRRRRHDANRREARSRRPRTSAAAASASATSLRASSACTPASTSRTARERPRSISWWATPGSGLEGCPSSAVAASRKHRPFLR